MESIISLKGEIFINNVGKLVKEERMIGKDFIMFEENCLKIPMDTLFMTDYYILVQIFEGEEILEINMKPYKVSAPCMLVMLPEQSIKVLAENGLPKQRGIAISKNALGNQHMNPSRLSEIHHFFMLNPVIQLDSASIAGIDIYAENMKFVCRGEGIFNREECATFTTMAFIYGTLGYMCKQHYGGDDNWNEFSKPNTCHIVTKFLELVKDNFASWHKAGDYADAIKISSKYLYSTIKKATGHTASYWIDYYIMAEGKRLLATSDLSMLEISNALGFSSQSDFTKFFRRLYGNTPSKYRSSLNSASL